MTFFGILLCLSAMLYWRGFSFHWLPRDAPQPLVPSMLLFFSGFLLMARAQATHSQSEVHTQRVDVQEAEVIPVGVLLTDTEVRDPCLQSSLQ